MLPRPTLVLTIPSIHDDTVLDCRIYSPPKLLERLQTEGTEWRKKAAIVAHPYAPLGGCYDDPIVDIVAAGLLDSGFFVGTFNFRGAGGSKGRTSWTAKPETDDYISFIGLLIYFMHYLSIPKALYSSEQQSLDDDGTYSLTTIPSQVVPPHSPTSPSSPRPSMLAFARPSKLAGVMTVGDNECDESGFVKQGQLLLLAGYSYGALVATQLPSHSLILSLFSAPELGSAASEIRLRAVELAKQQNEMFKCMAVALQEKALHTAKSASPKPRRVHSLHADDHLGNRKHSSTSSIRLGGEETRPDIRRSSQDRNRRSFSIEHDRIRRSVDRMRSLGRRPDDRSPISSRRHSSTPGRASSESDSTSLEIISPLHSPLSSDQRDMSKMEQVNLDDIKVSYLLVSPLQGLVNKLATVWTLPSRRKSKDGSKGGSKGEDPACATEMKLVAHSTLAVFGDGDIFSSVRKLRAWAGRLGNEEKSLFRHVEIGGAGHFWHEEGTVREMMGYIMGFVSGL